MPPAPESGTEPSIEEILDSIRQIISDDEKQGEAEAMGSSGLDLSAKPEAPPPAAPADDVLELKNKIDTPPAAKPSFEEEMAGFDAAVKAASPSAVEVDMMDAVDAPPPLPPQAPKPEPVFERPMPPADEGLSPDIESLLTARAENAATDAFGALARKAYIQKGGGLTVEDVVRFEVRPLLRAWIDKNLPGMVERLVQKELEKISARFNED